jgi:hypothetical protein
VIILKRIKRIWEENKVLLVLAIILIICLTVVVIVTITYFYGTSTSVYGNRLDATEKVPLKNLDNAKKELEKNESIKSVSSQVKGNIVYLNVNFIDDTKMEDAKKIVEPILEVFSEDELNVYDIDITISCLTTEKNPGYTLMGARNANGSENIIWNNYTVEEKSAE